MLHEFLRTNRADLISRCRLKVSLRDSPPATAAELENGIPLILSQLFEALVHEQQSPMLREESLRGASPDTPAWIESGRTAGLHGAELFKLGYTLAQVVHDYGDLCQAITESAIENNASITVDEFHTFNRLLDNSIANAVSTFGVLQHSSSFSGGAQDIHDRLGTLADEQRKLVDTALGALDALKRKRRLDGRHRRSAGRQLAQNPRSHRPSAPRDPRDKRNGHAARRLSLQSSVVRDLSFAD